MPADAKVRDPDFADSVFRDLTPLQEAFLMQGFFPVHDPATPRYRLGDVVPRTDHVPATAPALVERRHIETLPGSAIRLSNSGGAAASFTIDVKYPSTTARFVVVVAAGSERVVHLELPPPWQQVVAAGAPLPACGTAGHRLVTVTVSAPGGAPQTMDSCAYLHAVATSTTGYAMSVSAAGGPQTGGGGSGMPTLLIVGVGALVALLVVAGVLVSRRRSPRPGA